MTCVDLYNYFRLVAGALNSRPYGLRCLTNNTGNKQELGLGVITPNYWRMFVLADQSLPPIKHADLFDVHKMGINHKLEELNKFHQSVLLPRLLEDVDRSHS